MNNNLITVQEAAVLAGITEGYIRRMFIKDGFPDLKKEKDYQKIGSVWLISRKAWLKHVEVIREKKEIQKEKAAL